MTELPQQIKSKYQEPINPKLAMSLFPCKLCNQKEKKRKNKNKTQKTPPKPKTPKTLSIASIF